MVSIILENEQIQIDLTRVPPGFQELIIDLPSGERLVYPLNRNTASLSMVTSSIAAKFLEYKRARGRTEATVTCYESLLNSFVVFAPKWPPDSQIVNDFLGSYRSKKRSRTTLAEYWDRLNNFFQWACDEGYINGNPMRRVPHPDKPPTDVEDIPVEDLVRVVSHLRQVIATSRPKQKGLIYERAVRDMAAVRLAYATGCRIGEISRLRLRDLSNAEKTITIRADVAKSKKLRCPCLSGQARRWLEAWLAIRPDINDRVFVGTRGNGWSKKSWGPSGIYQAWRTRQDEAGIKDHYTFHQIRHSHVTHSLNNGVPLHHVSSQAGHSSSDITARVYSHSHDPERQQAYEGRNPDDTLDVELDT